MHWANGSYAFALSGLLSWTYFLGFASAGEPLTLLATFIFFLLPLALVGLTVMLLRDQRLLTGAHIAALIIGLVALVPLYKQPWSPRHQFVAKVLGIQPGTTEAEVRSVMNGYLGGIRREEAGAVPETDGRRRFTHVISYRWDGDYGDYNADFGIIYLNGDRVVGTEFSPD